MYARRETAAWWAANNPVLGLDEPGQESDGLRRIKFGDGSTPWLGLPYSTGGGGTQQLWFTVATGGGGSVFPLIPEYWAPADTVLISTNPGGKFGIQNESQFLPDFPGTLMIQWTLDAYTPDGLNQLSVYAIDPMPQTAGALYQSPTSAAEWGISVTVGTDLSVASDGLLQTAAGGLIALRVGAQTSFEPDA
jgi:hypothetical protein